MIEPFAAWIQQTRQRTLDLARSLDDAALLGPRLAIVNPPLWELGHVAWFQERWILRRGGAAGLVPGADALYDSIAVPHDARWSLPLPTLRRTIEYLQEARDLALRAVAAGEADAGLVHLATHHEEMHLEAMWFTRQTLGYGPPSAQGGAAADGGGDLEGDAAVPGGTFRIGAAPDAPFAFDNERRAHEVTLAPFAIARAPVTQARFAAFVDDGGYRRRALWSEAGWGWREAVGAEAPVYWRRTGAGWERRHFDRWTPIEPHHPMVNVSWYEADAWCRWAGRRLPAEAEWEAAASGAPAEDGTLARAGRPYPWGDEPPTPSRAHLDGRAFRPLDVGALPASDSAFGCRQMLGNVWEWTATDFAPYPGFAPGPYREYSLPWFGTHKALRGGSFATPWRLATPRFRNFYTPDRRDVWAGFRTCAP